jgi:hypothetical protein
MLASMIFTVLFACGSAQDPSAMDTSNKIVPVLVTRIGGSGQSIVGIAAASEIDTGHHIFAAVAPPHGSEAVHDLWRLTQKDESGSSTSLTHVGSYAPTSSSTPSVNTIAWDQSSESVVVLSNYKVLRTCQSAQCLRDGTTQLQVLAEDASPGQYPYPASLNSTTMFYGSIGIGVLGQGDVLVLNEHDMWLCERGLVRIAPCAKLPCAAMAINPTSSYSVDDPGYLGVRRVKDKCQDYPSCKINYEKEPALTCADKSRGIDSGRTQILTCSGCSICGTDDEVFVGGSKPLVEWDVATNYNNGVMYETSDGSYVKTTGMAVSDTTGDVFRVVSSDGQDSQEAHIQKIEHCDAPPCPRSVWYEPTAQDRVRGFNLTLASAITWSCEWGTSRSAPCTEKLLVSASGPALPTSIYSLAIPSISTPAFTHSTLRGGKPPRAA